MLQNMILDLTQAISDWKIIDVPSLIYASIEKGPYDDDNGDK